MNRSGNKTDPAPAPSAPTLPEQGGEIIDALLTVHRCLELDDQVRRLLEYAAVWSGAKTAYLFTPDEADVRFMPTVTYPGGDSRPVPPHPGLDRKGAESQLKGLKEAPWDDLRPLTGRKGEASEGDSTSGAVALPVRAGGDALVCLILLMDFPEEAPERERIHRLLALARPALDNALRVDAMKELIIMDDTADCFNRRHFEESFPEELSRATRFHSALSLIFFDLDNLKSVNSEHGHAMGSRTLFEVSVRVKSKIRKFDKLFRFGGDEFCILLPETEWHGALEVAERVRESIAGRNFLAGRISEPEGVKVTASFGIASYPLHARTMEDMILRADRAMQRIKSGTKNSIAIAEIIGGDHES